MYEDCIYKGICEDECENLCTQYAEMSYLLKTSNLPKSQWRIHKMYPDECDLPAFERLAEIQENIYDFVKQGKNIYLYSKQLGNGKTTWMVKLLLQYFNEVWYGNGFKERGIIINVPTYLIRCKHAISRPDEELNDIHERILNCDLAILDDVTVTNLSNYDYTNLLAYVDSRLFSGKSTFYTGNYAPNELEKIVGGRLASRISSSEIIELKGIDNRR